MKVGLFCGVILVFLLRFDYLVVSSLTLILNIFQILILVRKYPNTSLKKCTNFSFPPEVGCGCVVF